MRAAVWTGGAVVTQEVDDPEIPEGGVLVRVGHVGLCGTDFAILHGRHPRARPPLVMGHELAGVVRSSRDPSFAPGDLVVAEPLISCGKCRACRTGHTHICRDLGLYGIDRPGGLAEYVALPAAVLHRLPAETDPVLAALTEPLAVAVHAVRLSGLARGDVVAVFGAGPIGVLTALVARLDGARQIVVAEPNEWRASVATQLGFRVAPDAAGLRGIVASLTDGEGADVVFDTAGHPSVAPELATAARVLGTIVMVAVYKEAAPIDLRRLNFAEQTVRGVRVYTRDDVTRAVALVRSGELGLERLPVQVFPLDSAAEAFAVAERGDSALKVLVASGTDPERRP